MDLEHFNQNYVVLMGIVPKFRFQNYSSILQLMYKSLALLYPILIKLVQVKFQHEEQSAYETHSSVIIMSGVALIIAISHMHPWDFVVYNGSHAKLNEESLLAYPLHDPNSCFLLLGNSCAPLACANTVYSSQSQLDWISDCIFTPWSAGCNIYDYIKLRGNERSMQLGRVIYLYETYAFVPAIERMVMIKKVRMFEPAVPPAGVSRKQRKQKVPEAAARLPTAFRGFAPINPGKVYRQLKHAALT
ncbi:LOW QUALITY PROTEIN: hypothetical protein OSB04_020468 [Centaurea solstitialis]|uniref:Uncharacterized protein n=1 Tax=Centaurea solstitialis TaxID=347529 RepID=A0AA38WDA8_9ASTR|nr:LOW QUALITY PROTEIN: hypothetical protein OSB04_020468 [Centaurea solstitialis]